jgi:signal transduction histidine kinase
VIAFCRVLLAGTTLALDAVDPKQLPWTPHLATAVLAVYLAYSAALFLMVRSEIVRGRRVGPYSVVLDLVWITLITLLTDIGATPFFLLNVFVISGVSLRWGFVPAFAVTVLQACIYPPLIYAASRWLDPTVYTFHRMHLFRPVYLVALGYLIGYLGEYELRSKRKLSFMLELITALRDGRSAGRELARLMRSVLRHFEAPRCLLVLHDPESKRYFTWDLVRRDRRVRLRLRISERHPLRLDFASSTEAILANGLPQGAATALCYDIVSGAMQRKPMPADIGLPADARTDHLMIAPVLVQRVLRGHAVIMREGRWRFTRDDLQFLLLVVGQAAAAFEAARLQEKAEEVAVLEERARIARDLHDGFIQSLAGIDLRVEAVRKMLDRNPGRVPAELDELQQTVDRGYGEVRHYLHVLRSSSREAHDLSGALDRVAAEFTIRDRLRVDLSLPTPDPGLPAATAYELAHIVREALRNAVRHGQATEAEVKLAAYGAHCSLVIRDNGRGFSASQCAIGVDGTVDPESVPWSIRERAAALGGSLRVRSQPGQGAEVHLLIPTGGTGVSEGVRNGRTA